MKLDEPTLADKRRLKAARKVAHRSVNALVATHSKLILTAFRDELSVRIRSASQMLIALLEAKGLSLDAVVREIEPQTGWVRNTAETASDIAARPTPRITIELGSGSERRSARQTSGKGRGSRKRHKNWLMVEAYMHSLEFAAELAGMPMFSRFGRVTISVPDDVPLSVLHGAVGRPVEDLIDLEFWRGRGWKVIGVEMKTPFKNHHAVVVATGSAAYRMPWARSDSAMDEAEIAEKVS